MFEVDWVCYVVVDVVCGVVGIVFCLDVCFEMVEVDLLVEIVEDVVVVDGVVGVVDLYW